jgi:hypothetical protein
MRASTSVFSLLRIVVVAIALLASTASSALAQLPALPQATLTMKAGQRYSYFQASARVGAAGMVLVPDANGAWRDIRNGVAYAETNGVSVGTSGAGISLFDIYAFDTSAIVHRSDFLFNTISNTFEPVNRGVLVTNPSQNVDTIWVKPSVLAAQPNVEVKDLRVRRITYKMDGRTFNAIRYQKNAGTDLNPAWIQSTYDLTSGMLLIQSYAVQVPNVGTSLAIMRLTSGRTWTGPGVNTRWPTAITKLTNFTWTASGSMGIAGAGGVSQTATLRWTNFRWTDRIVTLTALLNNQSQGTVQYIAGQVGAPWMSPTVLAALRTNQQIDGETALQYRVTVGSITGGIVNIYSIYATGYTVYQYRISTGDLLAVYTAKQNGISTSAGSIILKSKS